MLIAVYLGAWALLCCLDEINQQQWLSWICHSSLALGWLNVANQVLPIKLLAV